MREEEYEAKLSSHVLSLPLTLSALTTATTMKIATPSKQSAQYLFLRNVSVAMFHQKVVSCRASDLTVMDDDQLTWD